MKINGRKKDFMGVMMDYTMSRRSMQIWMGCLLVLGLLHPSVAAAPQYRYGEVNVSLNAHGVVVINYLVLNLQGQILTWGYPGWQWDPGCSVQSSWVAESWDDIMTGYANCSYGYFLWRIVPRPASDCLVLEVIIEARTEIIFDDIAWVLYLPVEQFAGYSATAVRSDGSTQAVTFRVEYVPGQAGLGPGITGAGWIVPFGEGVGVVTTIFSDVSPSGPYIDITDDRAGGGTTYSVRQILFPGMGNLPLKTGSSFTFYVYIHPYSSVKEQETARQRLLNILSLLGQGVKASEIADLIAAGELEAFVEKIQAQQLRLRLLYVAAAIAMVLVAVVIVLKLRKRGTPPP